MGTTSTVEPVRINFFTSSNLIFLMLIVAGLAGNHFNYEIFLNINFIFGGIFAMLALQFFDTKQGMFAAALIASYTYILWHHPYSIIILTAEVASVGWLMKRYKIGMVFADMLFWIIIGMPLIYFFYHIVMHIPNSSTFITMTKQSVNGIANALLARLIFIVIALKSRSLQISYREIICSLLAFFVLCPALIILGISSRADFSKTDRQIRNELIQESEELSLNLKNWNLNRQTAIVHLAEVAALKSSQQMQFYLEQVRKSDTNFLRIGLQDKKATVTAFYPLTDEQGQKMIGKNYADRFYFQILKQKLKPMLSEVSMSRFGKAQPRVSIIAPVLNRGTFNGYVLGVLNLTQLRENFSKAAESSGLFYTLLDKNGDVILSNRMDEKVMTPFARDKGVLHQLADKRIILWEPTLTKNTPVSEQWQKSFYIAESSVGSEGEWKLVLEQPIAPFQKILFNDYAGKLALLFLILLIALFLAELLSRWIIISLEELNSLTHELSLRPAADEKNIIWPESSIDEANNLIKNFKIMARSLSEQFCKIEHINQSLETRVEERTLELVVSQEALRLNQEQLLMSQEIGHTASWVYNLSTNKIFGSPEGLRIFGLPPNIGEYPIELIEACIPERERVHQALLDLISEEREYHLEYTINPANGSPSKMILSIARLEKDLQGNSLFVLGFVQDITEQKQMENELLEAKFSADSANRAKSAFLASMSHELRTPLNGVLGFTQLLQMDDLSPKHQEYLNYISQSGENLLALIDDILDLSKVEAEKIELESLALNIESIIEEIISAQSLKAKEKNISLSKIISCDLDKFYMGDALRLKQILNNFISNALKFTKAGNVTISVNVISKKEKSDFVQFLVSDTGIGMSQEALGIIFQPFVQASSGISREYGGTGLGLAISKKLVELMGGKIKAESVSGKGSTFSFEIPLLKTAAMKSSTEKTKKGDNHSQFKNLKVLLVEDNLANLNLGIAFFNSLECQVQAVGRASDALVLLEKENFELLLVDIQMPGMSGADMIKLIRENETITKHHQMAIALTASALKGDKERYLQSGFDGYVPKPIKVDVVVQEMKRVLTLQ